MKYARRELIYTKCPINIEVAVKSEFDEIKCICDLKQEAYEKLMELSEAYKHWKSRYYYLDLIKTRYLTQTINCRQKDFQERSRVLKKHQKYGVAK